MEIYPSQTAEARRQYRLDNRDRINANYRAAYRKNPKILARANAAYDPEGCAIKHKADPRRRMLTMAKYRAKQKGIPFDLAIEDFSVPEFCPALGIRLTVRGAKMSDASPTLDRLRPGRGYIRGNVVVLSLKANRIKNDATVNELFAVASWLKSITGDPHA